MVIELSSSSKDLGDKEEVHEVQEVDIFKVRQDKKFIIDFLFRNISLESSIELGQNIRKSKIQKIIEKTSLPEDIVSSIIKNFLKNLSAFNNYLRKNKIKWNHDLESLKRKVRIYLHIVHRMAPVFNYRRAKINLEILCNALSERNFFPKIFTQIAIIIYITDLKNPSSDKNNKLLQKNIRTLCNCSAYAFHMTRKRLNIE